MKIGSASGAAVEPGGYGFQRHPTRPKPYPPVARARCPAAPSALPGNGFRGAAPAPAPATAPLAPGLDPVDMDFSGTQPALSHIDRVPAGGGSALDGRGRVNRLAGWLEERAARLARRNGHDAQDHRPARRDPRASRPLLVA